MIEDHPLEPRGYVGILAEHTGVAQSVFSLLAAAGVSPVPSAGRG